MAAIDSVLAIDAASRTGWAFIDVDGSICSDSVDHKGDDGQAGLFDRYYRWLAKSANELKPAVVAYEIPQIGLANRRSSNESRLAVGGFLCLTRLFCHRNNLAFHEIRPGQVKKAATGNGKASKDAVMKGIRNRGFDVANTDEADAVAILIAAMTDLNGALDPTIKSVADLMSAERWDAVNAA